MFVSAEIFKNRNSRRKKSRDDVSKVDHRKEEFNTFKSKIQSGELGIDKGSEEEKKFL